MGAGIFILIGLTLWAGCLGIAKSLGGGSTSSVVRATRTFVAAWFMVCVMNMWIGVTQTGHAARAELPVFVLIFAVPVALAIGFAWRRLRRRDR